MKLSGSYKLNVKKEVVWKALNDANILKQCIPGCETFEKVSATEFLNATDVAGIYDSDPNKNKKAKKFSKMNIKDLRNMLVREDSMAGGYDLMDIVALKVIERSKIKTRIIKADIKTIENAMKGQLVGTEIIL